MNRLFKILDGIVDSSNDFTNEILADAELVIEYAEHGCDELISQDDAERIIEVGIKWLHDQENGNGEWSRMRHEAITALEDDTLSQIIKDIKKENDGRKDGSTMSDDTSNEVVLSILEKHDLEDDAEQLEARFGVDGYCAIRDAEAGIY